MVGGDVVGEEGLDIYRDAASGFHHPHTFHPDAAEPGKIIVGGSKWICKRLLPFAVAHDGNLHREIEA